MNEATTQPEDIERVLEGALEHVRAGLAGKAPHIASALEGAPGKGIRVSIVIGILRDRDELKWTANVQYGPIVLKTAGVA